MCPNIVARLLIVLSLAVTPLAGVAAASGDAEPNYTTQQLIITNGDGKVLLQNNAFGWSVPGVRFDARLSIRGSLDALAEKYGLKIDAVSLAGLFTYEYADSNEISTRSYYRATASGGEARAPADTAELAWVTRDEALARIASDSQRSPPSFVQQLSRLLEQPGTIWGGAFRVRNDDGVYRSEVLEEMHPLGRTLPE